MKSEPQEIAKAARDRIVDAIEIYKEDTVGVTDQERRWNFHLLLSIAQSLTVIAEVVAEFSGEDGELGDNGF